MPLTALPKILNQNLKKGIDKPGIACYNTIRKGKENPKHQKGKEMKAIYRIEWSFNYNGALTNVFYCEESFEKAYLEAWKEMRANSTARIFSEFNGKETLIATIKKEG